MAADPGRRAVALQAKPAAVKASAGNQELSAEQVDSIVQMTLSLAERLGLERVYVRPHIPQKKLSAALESYGANMSADEVLVLIDDTLFGGAKEGVLMGESKLAVKMVFDTPRLFSGAIWIRWRWKNATCSSTRARSEPLPRWVRKSWVSSSR